MNFSLQSVTSVKIRNVPHITMLLNYKQSNPSKNNQKQTVILMESISLLCNIKY